MLHRADKRREGGRNPVTLILTLLFITLLLLVLDEIGLLAPVKGQLLRVLAPAQRGLGIVRDDAGSIWRNIGGADDLRRENQSLQAEISRLREENIEIQALRAENQQLRQSLDLKERFRWRTTTAAVIGPVLDPDRQAIFIDRGADDGVALGMVVVGQYGAGPVAMVGVVEEVYPTTSRVLLITDYRSTISARVFHTTEDGQIKTPDGELQGRWQLGDWLSLVKIDREAELAEGDVVVTAGLSQRFGIETPLSRMPADVPIGTIQAVRSLGHSQEAEVRPFVDPKRVRDVWVIIDSD